jgi:ribosomal protein S14
MLFKKKKDFLIRKKFLKTEKLGLILNFLKKKISIQSSRKLNFLFIKKFQKLDFMSKTKISRRCILTNRSRAINRKFNISRVILRDMLQCSVIPGYSKAVW